MATMEPVTSSKFKVQLSRLQLEEEVYEAVPPARVEVDPAIFFPDELPRKFPDARRILNVIVALIGIILAIPIALIITLAILLTSPGPVLYKQTRVGVDRRRYGRTASHDPRRRIDWGGRPFTIYKFRTMRWDPDEVAQVWAKENDPRITRLGRFLRRTRLDELPQLINVLKGDMNVVGPRPEQPRIFLELRENIEGYAYRQRVLPGLTGLAQISQDYDRTLSDVQSKIRYDLEYIRKQSVFTDLLILIKTIPVVLLGGRWLRKS